MTQILPYDVIGSKVLLKESNTALDDFGIEEVTHDATTSK